MTSLFDLYKIGVGPSSSHTMGPMRAAFRFVQGLAEAAPLAEVTVRVQAELYGSLALTGIGHATDRAVLLGLSGHEPATVDPEAIDSVAEIRASHRFRSPACTASLREDTDLLFHRDQMFPPGAALQHPNGLRFTAFDGSARCSQPGHSSPSAADSSSKTAQRPIAPNTGKATAHSSLPLPQRRRASRTLTRTTLSIAEIMLANECARIADSRIPATKRQIRRASCASGKSCKAA
jgi:L-serine dehydratase